MLTLRQTIRGVTKKSGESLQSKLWQALIPLGLEIRAQGAGTPCQTHLSQDREHLDKGVAVAVGVVCPAECVPVKTVEPPLTMPT